MSQGIDSRKKGTNNALLLEDVLPITVTIILIISNMIIMAIFYKSKKEPAFDKRKIKLTLSVCALLNIPLLMTSIVVITHNIILDAITQIIIIYSLSLTILRSWNLIFAYQIGHSDFDKTGTNFWINNYHRFGSQTFPKYYCTVSFLIICIPTLFLSVYSNPFTYIYILYGIYIICTAIIIKLLKHINMQDQLNLAKEMKLYSVISIVLSIFMIIILAIINPKTEILAHFLIVVVVFILSISFILYPIYKYRKIRSEQAEKLADFIDSSETKEKSDTVTETETNNPTLKQFISKNKKCYDHFKSHLQQSWAVENLLFFSDAQLFRVNYSEFNNQKKNSVLGIRFDYLSQTEAASTPSGDTIESKSTEIEPQDNVSKWMYIYERYLSSSGLYQVNIESDGFQNMEEFKQKIMDLNTVVEEKEYFKSFESALLQVWVLMEGLYVYFRLRNDYKRIIAYSYHEKQNSEAEMVTVVERIEDFFDDL